MKWTYSDCWDTVLLVGPCRCTVEFVERIGSDEDMLGDYSLPQQRWNVSLLGTDEYGGSTDVTLAEGWTETEAEGQAAAIAFLSRLAAALTADLAATLKEP